MNNQSIRKQQNICVFTRDRQLETHAYQSGMSIEDVKRTRLVDLQEMFVLSVEPLLQSVAAPPENHPPHQLEKHKNSTSRPYTLVEVDELVRKLKLYENCANAQRRIIEEMETQGDDDTELLKECLCRNETKMCGVQSRLNEVEDQVQDEICVIQDHFALVWQDKDLVRKMVTVERLRQILSY